MSQVSAWHFVGGTLRDGRPIPPDGEWLVHEGEIVPCRSGLHASVRLIDALHYAPGSTVCRVIVRGDVQHHGADKLVGRERQILWRFDAGATLRQFARKAALSVAHLWDMPDIVQQYLETGDEGIRAAARDASWATAAARDASWATAAARDASWTAARDASWDAAWATAAARDAVGDATAAAGDAVGDATAAARDAALSKFGDELEAMVREAAARPVQEELTYVL